MRKWFKKVVSLALIPKEKVSDAFANLMDVTPDYDLTNFCDYMVENWIESTQHPINMWNHYDTINDPRTNNHIEGYHLKLDKYIVDKKPNIWAFLTFIKKEESTHFLNYDRLERNVLRIKGRSRKDLERDNCILKLRCNYLINNDLDELLEKLSDLIHEYNDENVDSCENAATASSL